MVLKSQPGVEPEVPGPLHRNCTICATHFSITLFNLDISYHHDDGLAVMLFIEGYGSETAGPRGRGMSCHTVLIASSPASPCVDFLTSLFLKAFSNSCMFAQVVIGDSSLS